LFVAQDIPAGTLITEGSVIEGPWPSTYPLPGLVMADEKTTVIGSRARIDLKRGEPVFSSQIVKAGSDVTDTASAIALKIKPGKVAVAVPMSRLSGVAYAIGTGDHIMVLATLMFVDIDPGLQTNLPNDMLLVGINKDSEITYIKVTGGRIFKEDPLSSILLATFYVPVETQRPRMSSSILVQDARVINVGNGNSARAVVATPQGTAQPSTTIAVNPNATPDVLILEVTPEEALAINFVIRIQGDITYALRSAGDTAVFNVPSLDMQRLMNDFKIDLPPKLSYGTNPRVDSPFIPVLGNDVTVQAR
jgi:Flp pilus assembly protein CpaB